MTTEQSEQITKEPEAEKSVRASKAMKNPRRVEAGKRLAVYHRKAKEALQSEKSKDDVEEHSNPKTGWMPELSLTTGLAIVGIGLTTLDLYFRWRKK